MAITPAFSPGPWITCGPEIGSVFRWIFENLYEQCSFDMAEKMQSSVTVGSRPISCRIRSYSSGLRPCSATISGVILGSVGIMFRGDAFRSYVGESGPGRNGFVGLPPGENVWTRNVRRSG